MVEPPSAVTSAMTITVAARDGGDPNHSLGWIQIQVNKARLEKGRRKEEERSVGSKRLETSRQPWRWPVATTVAGDRRKSRETTSIRFKINLAWAENKGGGGGGELAGDGLMVDLGLEQLVLAASETAVLEIRKQGNQRRLKRFRAALGQEGVVATEGEREEGKKREELDGENSRGLGYL